MRARVFNIGLNRAGTTSLTAALTASDFAGQNFFAALDRLTTTESRHES